MFLPQLYVLATFQVLTSHMWLMAIVLDMTGVEHFHCLRKLLDRAVLAYIRNSYIAGGKKSGNPREKWVEGANRQFTKENSYG